MFSRMLVAAGTALLFCTPVTAQSIGELRQQLAQTRQMISEAEANGLDESMIQSLRENLEIAEQAISEMEADQSSSQSDVGDYDDDDPVVEQVRPAARKTVPVPTVRTNSQPSNSTGLTPNQMKYQRELEAHKARLAEIDQIKARTAAKHASDKAAAEQQLARHRQELATAEAAQRRYREQLAQHQQKVKALEAAASAAQASNSWAFCYQFSPTDSTLYMTDIFRADSDADGTTLELEFSDTVGRETNISSAISTKCSVSRNSDELANQRYNAKKQYSGRAVQIMSAPRRRS